MNLLPLGGMLFDYLENISAALVIGRYPQPMPLFAALAPFFTLFKWLLVGGSFVLLFIALMIMIRRKKQHPRAANG